MIPRLMEEEEEEEEVTRIGPTNRASSAYVTVVYDSFTFQENIDAISQSCFSTPSNKPRSEGLRKST